MTDQNKALIVVILDRSGSMQSIKDDMIGGFKHFIDEQKALPGTCEVSLYQFDDQYGVVYEQKPIKDTPALVLEPRGYTALWDALGRTIVNVGIQLSKLSEDQRPGAMVVLIITDGQENASHEFTADRVRDMVKVQETDYKWKFAYLGAAASSFTDAQQLGIKAAVQYAATPDGVNQLYASTSNAVGSYRGAVQRGVEDAELNIALEDKK